MTALSFSLAEKGIAYRRNVPGAKISTFRIGGAIDYLIEPRTLSELAESLNICKECDMPFYVLGRGSNVLFDDAPMEAAVISTALLRKIEIADDRVDVACGCGLPRLAAETAKSGFGDLAFLCGIPGTVGGAVYMNAGAHGDSLGEHVESVIAYFPCEKKKRTLYKSELDFSYRKSVFKTNGGIVLSARLRLTQKDEPANILEKIRAFQRMRAVSQPLSEPSAGSIFLRPAEGVSAGKVIDEVGLKGYGVGGAFVSEKHAGFIVNRGTATADDVKRLIAEIQKIVKKEAGIRLVPEIIMIPD